MNNTFEYVEKLNPEMQRYLNCMMDIKRRWDLINKRLNSSGFQRTQINAESTCLQFRMIIELIFLANLSSHEGYYGKCLFELVSMWNVKAIIETIEKVNPEFYPQAIKIVPKKIDDRPEAAGEIHFFSPNKLPQEEILKMYAQCSELLHPLNPFAKEKNYALAFSHFPVWSKKIRNLLSSHAVQLVDKNLKIFCIIDFDHIGNANEIQVGFTHKVE